MPVSKPLSTVVAFYHSISPFLPVSAPFGCRLGYCCCPSFAACCQLLLTAPWEAQKELKGQTEAWYWSAKLIAMATTPGSPTSSHGYQGLLSPVPGGQSHSAVRRALLAQAEIPVAPQGLQYSGACNVIRGCTQSQSTSQTDNWKRSIVSWLAGTGRLWKRIFWGILTSKKGCFPVERKDAGGGGSSGQREHSFQHSSPGVVQICPPARSQAPGVTCLGFLFEKGKETGAARRDLIAAQACHTSLDLSLLWWECHFEVISVIIGDGQAPNYLVYSAVSILLNTQ